MMQSEDTKPRAEKIIPDGFTELVFNYGSVYRAKIKGLWYTQTPNLLAGQISRYFYLENTAETGSFAIKLKPAALTQLFGLNMECYLDQIVDLDTFPDPQLAGLKDQFLPFENEQVLKKRLDAHFLMLSKSAIIGLSPKYYARIIRFNYIFQLIKEKERNWAEIVYESGYYDQSHFIRNFKAFTGEDPSTYFFEESNMANFFLNK